MGRIGPMKGTAGRAVAVATLESIQVGRPRTLGREGADDPRERAWTTALFKDPVRAPVQLGPLGLEGDRQADAVNHGGREKAVCVYPAEHYSYWEDRLQAILPRGAFGENFTVAGQDEGSVAIGDLFEVGEALVQVSQPRAPCWKLARRWKRPKLPRWVQATGFTGWYLRVLRPGQVSPGDELHLIERLHEEWSVIRVHRARFDTELDPGVDRALSDLATLSEAWRGHFRRRLDR